MFEKQHQFFNLAQKVSGLSKNMMSNKELKNQE